MSIEDSKVVDAGRQHRPILWIREVVPGKPAMPLSPAAEAGASAKAIISQIRTCAQRLVAEGEASSIDLRFLRSMPEERATLAGLLGQGEVSAVVDSIGRSEVQETAIPCVWWIRHLNSAGETVGELIEIVDVPEILVGDRAAVDQAIAAVCIGETPGAGRPSLPPLPPNLPVR